MGLKVELISDYATETSMWQARMVAAVSRARVDLDLIVPLVEDYYMDRRPTGERVVYEWEVGKGVEAFERFLRGFMVVSVQYPGAKVRVSR